MQVKQREDEKLMKNQHEQLVLLEERCRKMGQLIKEKKKEKAKLKEESESAANGGGKYTMEELERLTLQVKEAEKEKVAEEKKLRSQINQQEQQIKSLNHELNLLNLQIKEKDQEYRLNELKIKELRRQVPSKVLKPLDAKLAKQRVSNLPPTGKKKKPPELMDVPDNFIPSDSKEVRAMSPNTRYQKEEEKAAAPPGEEPLEP